MGTASPPPTPPRSPAARPASPTPAAGTPPLGPQVTARSRFHFEDRPVAMGPSGISILLTLAAIGVGIWLYVKPPSTVGAQTLQLYSGFESNMESVSLKDCSPPGCAAVYLTPTKGRQSNDAIPGAVALANELAKQDIDCFLVIGQEPIPEAVKRARGVRRPVVFDPFGQWAKDSGIEKAPYWIAWRTGGNIRLRSEEPVTAADVVAAIR